MNARTLVREEAASVRHAMARAARGQGSALALSCDDASGLLTHVALEASSTGWHVVEMSVDGDTRQGIAKVARELGPGCPGLLDGAARPLADLLAGEQRSHHDLAFALLVALDRLALDRPVLLAVHDIAAASPGTVAVLGRLADLLPRTRCLMLHEDALPTDGDGGEADDADGPATPPPPAGAVRLLAGAELEPADDERLTRDLERAREHASSREYGVTAAWRGIVRSRVGLAADALPDLVAGLSHGADDEPLRASMLRAALVDSWLAVGELHQAGKQRGPLTDLSTCDGPAAGIARLALAELAAAAGDHATAATAYRDAADHVHPDQPGLMPWRRGAAVAALHLGRPAEARRLALADVEQARVLGATDHLAQALRTLAAIDLGPRSAELLQEARETLAGSWSPRLAAQLDTDLAGQIVLSRGDTERAVALLRGAEELAVQQRLEPLRLRVQRVLGHLGASIAPTRGSRARRLDVVELQAATLAARGLSDQEVADHLLVPVGEVQAALRHAFRVLGIRARTRLADVLAE